MGNICRPFAFGHRGHAARRVRAALVLVVIFLLLLMHNGASAQVGTIYPVDESGKDHSFAVFRAQLLTALKRRDRRLLMSVVHPKVKNSFGDNDGAANFVKQWHPERPDSQVWDVLLTAIELGGTFEGSGAKKTFCGPYVYSRFPDDLDPFTHEVIIAKNVTVRAKPAASAPIKSVLSYAIVKVPDVPEQSNDEQAGWVKVMLKSGEGYVPKSLIRRPLDYRFCFQRVRQKWLLTLLVAGD